MKTKKQKLVTCHLSLVTASQGFTLIEVLITATIMVVLGGLILTLINIVSRTRLSTFQNLMNIDQTNAQVSTMVRELRNIQVGDNAAYPLERAADQEIIFYSDIDYDGETEKVRYSLNGTQLEKGVIEPTGYPPTYPSANEKVRILTEDVRNGAEPIFYYYNGDWPADTVNNPLAQPVRLSESKLMKIYLKLNTKDEPTSDFILESYTQLRILKENL
jgi:prepilin-type N-terminal cleavage/methylation domain-containing protein